MIGWALIAALLALAPGAPLPWFAGWTADEAVYNRTRLLEGDAEGHVLLLVATWCGPCGDGLEALAKQRDALADAKLRIVLVACGETPAKVEPWLAKHGWPAATVVYDRFGQIARDLGAEKVADGRTTLALPRAVLTDRKGTVLGIFDAAAAHDLAAWRRALRSAAAR